MQMKDQFFGTICSTAKVCAWTAILVVTLALLGGLSYGQGPTNESAAAVGISVSALEGEKESKATLAVIGAKLSNPVSDIWALFTEFDLYFNNGKVNQGNTQVGGRMIFQPIMPFPLYGAGENEWKLITRPNVPVPFSQPIPTGFDNFRHQGGLGDIQLPMPISPPTGNWLLGLGPCWLFPTATYDVFGRQQWGVGPTGVFGYKTKDWLAIVFPQYYFGIGSTGGRSDSTPDASYLNLLYALVYNLPNAWQVGFNPTITYDHHASSGDRWNVPVGLFVAKTTKIGRIPVKFQLGVEYSVVNQKDFGQRAQIKLNVIPVIPSLVKKPILGGE
jgi:hypothetical protein